MSRIQSVTKCNHTREFVSCATRQGADVCTGGNHQYRVRTDRGTVPLPDHPGEIGNPLLRRIIKELLAIGLTVFVLLVLAALYCAL